MKKIVFFVPKDNAECVKIAMYNAGAGKIGNYEQCCFQSEGIGQFRPLQGSSPQLGSLNELESVIEYRIEMICPDDILKNVINALRGSHVYEEPAIDVYELLNF